MIETLTEVPTVDPSSVTSVVNKITALSVHQIIAVIIVLCAGIIIIKVVDRWVKHITEVDMNIPSLTAIQFQRIVKVFLILIITALVLEIVGLDISGLFTTVAAAFALIIGFGMKDTINNIASGIWISASGAYDIGDEVTLVNQTGIVKSVNLMSTELKQLDNTRIMIPNGSVWNSPIINITKMDERMIIVEYGVAYGTNIDKAMQVGYDTVRSNPKLLCDPKPIIRFLEMGDSDIKLQMRVWVDTDDYYQTKSDLLKALYTNINKAGIEIPYPQLDIHISKE